MFLKFCSGIWLAECSHFQILKNGEFCKHLASLRNIYNTTLYDFMRFHCRQIGIAIIDFSRLYLHISNNASHQ